MNVKDIIQIAASVILMGIPFAIRLVEVTREAMHERNWNLLIGKVALFMTEAEIKYDDDHNWDRKQYVLQMAENAAHVVNYHFTTHDREKLSELIDSLCTMAQTVNNKGKG